MSHVTALGFEVGLFSFILVTRHKLIFRHHICSEKCFGADGRVRPRHGRVSPITLRQQPYTTHFLKLWLTVLVAK